MGSTAYEGLAASCAPAGQHLEDSRLAVPPQPLVQGMGFSYLKKGSCWRSGKAGCGLGLEGAAVPGKETEAESPHTLGQPSEEKGDVTWRPR